jgi:DNA-binding transcriptional ArsR family regulator
MPRLAGGTTTRAPETTIDFVVSPSLDMTNTMYFTYLAKDHEGLEGFAAETRKRMAPDFLREFDFLYEFPMGEPGLMGTLGDMLWKQPQTWSSVDALLEYVRNLPLDIGSVETGLGVQGLAFNVTGCDMIGIRPDTNDLTRDGFIARLRKQGVNEADALELFERPEELRERLANMIERFYNEFYKPDMPRRMPCLERSVAFYRSNATLANITQLLKKASGRDQVCLEPDSVCPGPWERLVFAPSLDMGPYMSCAIIGDLHGMFYPCESRFVTGDEADDDAARMARIYKALSDEQRLRILQILGEREMYAQEVVDRTGLHQSQVSRHLSFLKAVGLLNSRREGSMKHFSINPDARRQLQRTLELFPEGGRK